MVFMFLFLFIFGQILGIANSLICYSHILNLNLVSQYTNNDSCLNMMITFHVSCRGREMYSGHSRMCVCLSMVACPHYCTDPDVTFPLVVYYQVVSNRCTSFVAMATQRQRKMSASACTHSMPGLFLYCLLTPDSIGQQKNVGSGKECFLWLPCVADADIILLSCFFFFFLFLA